MIGNSKWPTALNSIEIDGEAIESVYQFKYLGVIIDHKLNFKENVDYVCKKAAKKVGILSRLAKNLTFGARVSIYKSVIAPHFDYCSSLLFLCNEASMDRLQKIQNKAMRVVLRCSRMTSIENMLKALDWPSVKQRIYASTMFLIFKLKHGLLPEYLSEMVSYSRDIHQYPTRTRDNFWISYKRSASAMNYLFHKGLIQFNALPSDIKSEKSDVVFKRKLKLYLRQIL